jgi:hypothetical protein
MKSPMDVSTFPKRDLSEYLLEWRGIEDPCKACSGSGYIVYGSTSTYLGRNRRGGHDQGRLQQVLGFRRGESPVAVS